MSISISDGTAVRSVIGMSHKLATLSVLPLEWGGDHIGPADRVAAANQRPEVRAAASSRRDYDRSVSAIARGWRLARATARVSALLLFRTPTIAPSSWTAPQGGSRSRGHLWPGR